MDPDPDLVAAIAGRAREITDRIRAARLAHGLPAEGAQLVAVSKSQPDARIRAALAAGLRVFGENRLQEAQVRWRAVKEEIPDLVLHFVGRLQRNKVADVVALFDVIHSIDRERLIPPLARAIARQGRMPELLVQVNTGGEPQKGGVLPGELPRLLKALEKADLPVAGLMCIPPVDDEPALHFALLKELARRHGLARLSMGMSGDYEIAAACGADYLRVGTALFGPRLPLQKRTDAA
ncbi:MAG: YggS family pyridoxal phosphate-dependent enzyme [Alphaproteobacteria bacterium]|nr:MAG: YggS family pyridoxal phosphate-dependent enzyme [Alphaproteobacteria bacterium]